MKSILFTLAGIILCSGLIAQDNNPRTTLDWKKYPFYHGVASGDPLHDKVILWTRVTDDTLTADSVEVEWRIALDTGMTNIINSGAGYTSATKDWTFKVDADGLQPYTWYYYDFYALDRYSVRGRTKTAPLGDVDSTRFAVVSCARYYEGYYDAYKYITERNDLDAVIHLGDYIYEKGGGSNTIGRDENQPPHEIVTLEDYRLRYSQYHLDEDLRLLHQQYPFITVWDDHESSNNSWSTGAEDHDPGTEGLWTERIANAGQAYHEWLPIRSPQPGSISIYRKVEYGDLIDLFMIDTRIEGRDEMVGTTSPDIDDPSRTMLGNTQFEWFTDGLKSSTTNWRIVGNQVMMAPLEIAGIPLNDDQWDGYRAERTKLFDTLQTHSIDNFVVLTGDIHTSWVNDLPGSGYDASSCINSMGIEYVVPSVTTQNGGTIGGIGSPAIQAANSHMHYVDLSAHGYVLLDVTKARVTGHYYNMNDITSPGNGEYLDVVWYCDSSETCAEETQTPAVRPGPQPIFAPDSPVIQLNTDPSLGADPAPDMVMFGVYPNPFYNEMSIQLFLQFGGDVEVSIYDMMGKMVLQEKVTNLQKGLNYITLFGDDLSKGTYSLVIKSDNHMATKKIIKLF